MQRELQKERTSQAFISDQLSTCGIYHYHGALRTLAQHLNSLDFLQTMNANFQPVPLIDISVYNQKQKKLKKINSIFFQMEIFSSQVEFSLLNSNFLRHCFLQPKSQSGLFLPSAG